MVRALPLLLLPALGALLLPSAERPVAVVPPATADTGHYVVADSLHRFRFSLLEHAPDDSCRALAVDIHPLDGNGPDQHLVLDGLAVPCPMANGRLLAVEVMDLNFDGIRDLRLVRANSDPALPQYRYWLFDADQKVFTPCTALDSLQHPNFDRARRMVGSQWYTRKGLRGTSTFYFQGTRLVMLANMEKYTEGDHERWVTWGRKDGRFQPVSERIVPLGKH